MSKSERRLNWAGRGSLYHRFSEVDYWKVGVYGVYVGWCQYPRMVYHVGQVNIGEQIKTFLCEQPYFIGDALVTWASAPDQSDRNGIEIYLAESLRPIYDKRRSPAAPIPVNLP